MTSRDFCFWLQGFLELRGEDAPITVEQAKCIQRHLALVFVHEIDPSAGGSEHQAKLNEIHTPQPEREIPTREELKKLLDERVRPHRGDVIMRC